MLVPSVMVKRGPAPVRCLGCGRVLLPEIYVKNGPWCRKCYVEHQMDCPVPCHECPDYPCWSVTT